MSAATPANIPKAEPLSIGEIAQRIHLIRGQRVVLDTDLAAFYGATTKRFNHRDNRNLAQFPPGFMFQLDEQEFADLIDSMAELLGAPPPQPKRAIEASKAPGTD